MSKHTPGPWYPVGAWVETERDDIPDICTCNPDDMGQGHLKRSYNEIRANAILIAAAPELLEFAEYVAALNTGGMIERKAKEVIAKAKGETCPPNT